MAAIVPACTFFHRKLSLRLYFASLRQIAAEYPGNSSASVIVANGDAQQMVVRLRWWARLSFCTVRPVETVDGGVVCSCAFLGDVCPYRGRRARGSAVPEDSGAIPFI